MKKIFGIFICGFLIVSAFAATGFVGLNNKAVCVDAYKTANFSDGANDGQVLSSAAVLPQNMSLYYTDSNKSSEVRLSTANVNDQNYIEYYSDGEGNKWGAIYGAQGMLFVNASDDFDIDLQIAFSLPGDNLVFNQDFPGNDMDYDFDENDRLVFFWTYNAVGVYKLMLEVTGENEYEEDDYTEVYEYYIVCKNGEADFGAQYRLSDGSINKDSITYYNDFSGEIVINASQRSENFYSYVPESAGSNIISLSGDIDDPEHKVTIKNAQNQSVKDEFFSREGSISFDEANQSLILTVDSGVKLKNGTYTISFSVLYYYANVASDGSVQIEQKTDSVTAVLIFATRPKDTSFTDLLLGVLILGVLGGAFWGISYLTKRMQNQHQRINKEIK